MDDGHLDALSPNIAASDSVTGRMMAEASHIAHIYQTLKSYLSSYGEL
jgi:hypothetical protein